MKPAVIRYLDGRLIKGYAAELTGTEDSALVRHGEKESSGTEIRVPLEELKAIFYVRKVEGHTGYHEQKKYGLRERMNRKVIIRFSDGEFLVGFLDGDVPWDKGFFLSKGGETKGFYLVPADEQSNNLRVFVVTSAISDVTTP